MVEISIDLFISKMIIAPKYGIFIPILGGLNRSWPALLIMKITLISTVLHVVIFLIPCFSRESSELQDSAVLTVVLNDDVLPGLIKGWQISKPELECMVLSDEAIPAMFPQSAEQEQMEREVTSHWKENQNVDWEAILDGRPDGKHDYVMSQNHVIPKDVVKDMLARSNKKSLLPTMRSQSPLRVVVEKSSFINRTFRTDDGSAEFGKMYPCAHGVIEMSLPGYSQNGNVAGVYFSQYRLGIGGAGSFVLLHRINAQWRITWTHTAWIE